MRKLHLKGLCVWIRFDHLRQNLKYKRKDIFAMEHSTNAINIENI